MKNWKEVEGWIHDDEFSILQELSKGKDCLEIGSYYVIKDKEIL